jgi:hypothetical protein
MWKGTVMKRKAILWAGLILVVCVAAQGAQWPDLWAYYPINQDDFKDYSGNGHDGTPVDGAQTQLDPARGWVATFGVTSTAGTTGRVICGTGDPSAGGQLTVCAWVKWGGSNSNWQGVAGKSDNYNARRWILQLRNNAAGSIQWGGADRLTLAIESTTGLPVGQWAHIAGTWNGTTMDILINGAVIQTGEHALSDEGAAAPITLGIGEYNVSAPQTNSFNGVVDEVRMFSRGLSAEEVLMVMNGATPQQARKPRPADLATGVSRETILTWNPGKYAVKHDVYLGTSFSDVNTAGRTNPMGVLLSVGQDANSFTPPRLALGQTYYWRIDEINAPPSETTFKGNVWSFTAEPIGYVMTNITATASSQYAANSSPQNTVNGSGVDISDLHSNDTSTMWVTAKGDKSPWIQFDFNRVYKLHEMWVWNYNGQLENLLGFGLKNVTIQYSVDGTAWTKLGDFEFARGTAASGYPHGTTVGFDGAVAKYVKLSINSGWGTRGQYGLSEVRFFYVPVQALYPVPTSGATGLTPDISLSWQAGREAVSNKVFLGTDPNAVAAATTPTGTVSQSSYTPAGLIFGTTYYWRIDEVNMAAGPTTWEGDVWSFSTGEYMTIDDMESYDDTTNKIYDAWVDGYNTNTNGSLVGLDQSANGTFGDTTIFHGGRQSMPMRYSNTNSATYSEATRTFDPVQDWSVGGADTLSLYVRGVPINFLESNGVIRMNGTGTDIWGTADQFHFAYKQLSGDGSMIARVESIDRTADWAKCGVMIRVSLDAASAYADCVVAAVGTASFQQRLANGGDSASTDVAGRAAPYWVKITRSTNTFTAALSPDGVTWTPVTTASAVTITMPTDVLIGLCVSSHDAALLTQAKFSNISTTGKVTGAWTVADVGVANPPGNAMDTLYLAIEDNTAHRKVVTATDPYAMISGTWQQWKIPLSELSSAGVKLNSIKMMTLGIGDKTKAASGATGTLYIDDIQFGHPAQ